MRPVTPSAWGCEAQKLLLLQMVGEGLLQTWKLTRQHEQLHDHKPDVNEHEPPSYDDAKMLMRDAMLTASAQVASSWMTGVSQQSTAAFLNYQTGQQAPVHPGLRKPKHS